MKRFLAATAAALLFALPSAKGDTTLDLTAAGNSGILNHAFYQQINPQSTGTGVIDSFLRIQANGNEAGFNTNASPPPLDDKAGNFTHAITLGSLATFTAGPFSPTPSTNTDGTTAGATTYYRFLLDVNQTSSNNLLSMNSLQIYTGAGLSDISTLSGTLRYDMNATGTNAVTLNYALNSGSGSGDMFLYVPTSDFAGVASTDNVILYAQFGKPPGTYSSNDGFEEWAAATTTAGVPLNSPEPSTITLALAGLVGFGFAGLRRLRRRQPATV
jgi:MYXO-CTERM domain-containing protein